MSSRSVPLSQLIQPGKTVRAGRKEYPILSMTMHGGLVDQASKFKKRVASADTSAYKVIERDQLVVGFPIDEGVLSFQRLHDTAIVSPAYDVWDISDKQLVEPPYLERFLRSPLALTYYKAKLRGSTARRRSIPDEVFLRLPVPLPPLPEQRRIAAILDKADELRAKRRAALAKLDTLPLSIFLDMFGDPTTNPLKWPVVKLIDVVDEFRYGTSNKSGPVGLPALRIPNVVGGVVDTTELKLVPVVDADLRRLALRDGDLLLVRSNGNPDAVGRCAVFDRKAAALSGFDPAAFVFASYLIRARLMTDLVVPEYLREFMLGPEGRRQLRAIAKTSAGQFNINTEGLAAIRLPLPPAALQDEYCRRIAAVASYRAMYLSGRQVQNELFASLQHRSFRGEL